MNPTPERICVSVAEAAQLLGVSRWAVYQRVKDGTLNSRKLGRRVLIDYAALRDYATSLEPATDGEAS